MDQFTCKGCGRCCNLTNHPYLDVEIVPEDNLAEVYTEQKSGRDNRWMKRKADGTCIFLNDKNECEIYQTRPKECRDFTQGHPVCIEIMS